MTWSSPTSLKVSLKNSTSPSRSVLGIATSLPFSSAFSTIFLPGICMPTSSRTPVYADSLPADRADGSRIYGANEKRPTPLGGSRPRIRMPLNLATERLQEGLAVLVVLLVVADGLDVVLREALDLLLDLPDAEVVVVLEGHLGVLARLDRQSVV